MSQSELLTRDQFREAVFARDSHKCVNCKAPGQDAHHILERRLWSDGGYYIDNGATVCGPCHLLAESTELSADEIRAKAGITCVLLPSHLYPDQVYDKWGNPVLPSGLRYQGELFEDESVQKVIKPVLHLFSNRVKYPRTWHLPWSPGFTEDDRVLSENLMGLWQDKEVVVTEKFDGENTSMYRDYIHARSLDYESRYDRDRIKAFHATIAYDIPENWRICGENLTAVHSLRYTDLPHFFMVYSMWNGLSCISWDDTVINAGVLGLQTVPVLYRGLFGMFDHKKLEAQMDFNKQEGYVVRFAGSFRMQEFKYAVGKFVRPGHVADSHVHWTRRMVEWNGWKEK